MVVLLSYFRRFTSFYEKAEMEREGGDTRNDTSSVASEVYRVQMQMQLIIAALVNK